MLTNKDSIEVGSQETYFKPVHEFNLNVADIQQAL